jgi:drug/metabolite transporter (DMT)-like permease
MNRYLKGHLFVIASAVIYGSMPLVAKTIYRHGVNAVSLVLYRNLFAMLPLLFWVRRRQDPVRIRRDQIIPIVTICFLGGAATPILLFSSYHYISSGTATTVHFIYPIFVFLGCALFFHEPLNLVKSLCVALCTAGILLFYTPGEQLALSGLLQAFASGITFAAYVISLNKCGSLKGVSSVRLSLYMTIVCSVIILFVALITGSLTFPDSGRIWVLCAGFAIVVSLGATVCFQTGAFMVGSQHAAIFSTFEPVTSLIIGVAVLQEPFSWKIALGALLILSAVVLLTVWDKRHETVL